MSYFNEEQQSHMRYLATIPATSRCWSGWCTIDPNSNSSNDRKYCSGGGHSCPLELSLADRKNMECELCGNYPNLNTGRDHHNAGCSHAARVDHYAALELGGEA